MNRFEIAAIVLITIIAAGVRLYQIDDQALWLDEIWHAELSTGRGSAHFRIEPNRVHRDLPNLVSLSEAPSAVAIWRNMDWVLHPPLYHTVLRGWREAVGDSGARWRGLSAVIGVVCVPMVYLLLRRPFGATAALTAAGVLALAGSHIAQSRDTRGYTLAMGVVLLGGWATQRAAGSSRLWFWSLLVFACCLALPFIHYFAASVVVGFAAFALLELRGRQRWTITSVALGSLIVFAMAWGPTVLGQLKYVDSMADPFLKDASPGQWLRAAGRVASLPARLIADPGIDTPIATAPAVQALMLIVGIAGWVMIAVAAFRCRPARVWIFSLLATAGLLAVLDVVRQTQHLAYTRYAITALPGVLAAIAWTISTIEPLTLRRLAIIALIAATAATMRWGYVQTADCRPMLRAFAHQVEPGEAVIFASPDALGHSGQSVYLYCTQYADVFPRDVVIATQPLDAALIDQLPGQTAWVLAANPATDGTRVVPGSTELNRIHSPEPEIGVCIRVRLPRAKMD